MHKYGSQRKELKNKKEHKEKTVGMLSVGVCMFVCVCVGNELFCICCVYVYIRVIHQKGKESRVQNNNTDINLPHSRTTSLSDDFSFMTE